MYKIVKIPDVEYRGTSYIASTQPKYPFVYVVLATLHKAYARGITHKKM